MILKQHCPDDNRHIKVSREIDVLEFEEDFHIEEVNISYESEMNASKIIDAIFQNTQYANPYFCYLVVSDYEFDDDKKCIEQVSKLFGPINKVAVKGYIVHVLGSSWGDYEEVIVYLHNPENENQLLRYAFDIVHEI